MNRAMHFLSIAWRAKDGHSLVLFAIIVVIAVWLLLLPLSKAVQHATIDRFHLTTDSFAAWAVQQPIPPMYNLENRFWYSPRPLRRDELTNPPPPGVQSGMLNHFPARMITCASGRLLMLQNHKECWFYLRSRYRQSERITAYKLSSVPDSNNLRMELVPEGQDF